MTTTKADWAKTRAADWRDDLEPILDEMTAVCGCSCAFIVVMDSRSGLLEDAFGSNLPHPMLETFGPSPVGEADTLIDAIRSGEGVWIHEVTRDPRVPRAHHLFYAQAGITSFGVVPLASTRAALVIGSNKPTTEAELFRMLPYVSKLTLAVQQGEEEEAWVAAGHVPRDPEWEWYGLMLNAVPDPLVISDEHNNIIYQNARAMDLLVTGSDEAEGKRRAIELNNFLLSAALSLFALGEGTDVTRDFTLVDPVEGSELLFEVISTWTTLPSTGQRGLVSVLRDVTDLQWAVQDLRNSLSTQEAANEASQQERDRLRLILTNVADPVVVTDESGEVVLKNPAAERLLGSLTSNPSPRSASAYYTNEAKLMSFLLTARLEPEETQSEELEMMDSTTDRSLSMAARATKVRNQFGQVAAVVCVLHDLTQVKEVERQRLESRLFESEKLAAVGRMAAAVAHEINNPLESVKTALYLLTTSAPQEMPDREFLNIADREVQRISRIIRQMLGLYRPSTRMERTDINRVVDEAVSVLQRHLRGRHIEVNAVLDKAIPPVLASSDQLIQVLLNLLLNAADAIGERDNGQIKLTTRIAADIDKQSLSKKYVLVEVSDNGGGIASEHLEQLFNPFFSTKQEERGTGLGLWVSQDIVRQHGGQVLVETSLGQGATFTVALPMESQND